MHYSFCFHSSCRVQGRSDINVRANTEQFQEVGNMCEALKKLMKDEFDAVREDALKQGMEQGIEQFSEAIK